MKVAVWDTYVKLHNKNIKHFDIIVPENEYDSEQIFKFGKEYLNSKNEKYNRLDSDECQLCHIEVPTKEMLSAIEEKGYYILDLGEIPAELPENPSRRDLILYLRGHFKSYRFADFKNITDQEILTLIERLNSDINELRSNS